MRLAFTHGMIIALLVSAASAFAPLVHSSAGARSVSKGSRTFRPPLEVAMKASSSPASRDGPLASIADVAGQVRAFIDRRYFLVGVVTAVGLAALWPSIGRKGGILRPELTVAWGATCGIFLLAGISLPTNQLAAAALKLKEHALIQWFNLAFMPVATLGVCSILRPMAYFESSLLEGMLLLSALPTTINMCVALTRSSDGNESLSIFNAVLGNLIGVFVTPALLLLLVGKTGAISSAATFKKLSYKVLVPVFTGQVLGRVLTDTLRKRPASKKIITRASETLLLLTVYSTFCDTFSLGFGLPASKLAMLLLLVCSTHVGFLAAAWQMGRIAKLSADDQVAVLFTSTHKTLALGLPLLNLMFSGRPDVGLLCTPLLLQHPLQLFIGSLLSARLARYVADNKVPMDVKTS